MTIDGIVIRKANDISKDNEIAKFSNLYFVPQENISAISVEFIDNKDINTKLNLLVSILKICNENKLIVSFMTCLQEQPNNRITRYKGGWKLLNNFNYDAIFDKNEIVIYNGGSIDFILEGNIDIRNLEILNKMIYGEGILYFSTNNIYFDNSDIIYEKYDDWINNRLNNNEFVCFILQTNWEQGCEVVIMRKNNNILNDEFIDKICREISLFYLD